MNKPMIMALSALAFFASAEVAVPAAFAQYGGGGAQTATPQQLQECQQLNIPAGECNDTTILAKRRLTAAQANPSTGSGTPMLSTESGQMIIFIGVLGAIFGGVAAAFFFRSRGSRKVTT